MSLWRSPILYVGIVLVLLVTGLLSAPVLVNWNTYRSSMEDYGRRLTGRDVQIVGDISVHLFPWPRLRLEGVRIANPPGTMLPEMMRAQAVEARMLLGSLISGYVDLSDIRIEKPVFSLERLASGGGSWWLAPQLHGAASIDANRISIDKLRIVDGTVFLSDIRRGGTAQLNDFNAEISAQSLLGPWKARGELQYKDLPLAIGLSTGKFREGDPFKFGLRVSPVEGGGLMYSFEGDYEGNAEAPVTGLIKAEPYVAEGGKADSQSQLRPFSLKSKLTIKDDRAVLDNIEIAPAEQPQTGNLLTGSAYVDMQSRLAISANLRSPKFDLDSVLGNEGRQVLKSGAFLEALSQILESLPDTLDGELKLNVGNLIAGGQNLENVTLTGHLVPQGLTVSELSATMPGQTKGKFSGLFLADDKMPQLSGDIWLESANTRELASWIMPEWKNAIDTRWTGARGKLSFHSKVDQAPRSVRLSESTFTMDDTSVSGSLSIGGAGESGTNLRLIVDRLDLDRYAPEGLHLGDFGGSLTEKLSAIAGAAANLGNTQLVVQADSVAYHGAEAKDLAADITAKGDTVEIRTLDVGSVGDARLEVSGILEPNGAGRQGSATISVSAVDPRPLLRLVGLVPPVKAGEAEPPWVQALGPLDVTLRGDLDTSGERALGKIDMKGTAGGSLISAHAGYDGAQGAPREAQLSFEGDISSPSEKALAVLFGIGGQTDEQDQAQLTWRVGGQWINGLQTSLELRALGGFASFDGAIQEARPDGALTAEGQVAIEVKPGDRVFAAMGIPNPKPGAPLRIDTQAKVAPGRLSLTNFRGTIDQQTYGGNLSFADGNINVAASAAHISLPWLLRYALLPADGRPIDEVTLFSPQPLGGANGSITVESQVLNILPGIDVQNGKTELSAHDGEFKLAVGGIGPAGAPLLLEARTVRQNDELQLTGSFEGGLDLGSYLLSPAAGQVLTGPVALKGKFTGHGRSPAGLALTLAGTGRVEVLNATLKGFDARHFALGLTASKSAADVDRVLRDAFGSGEMSFEGGEGKFVLADGEAVFGPLPVDVGDIAGSVRAIVEMSSGKVDVGVLLGLKVPADMPPVELAYTGPRDGLVRSFDASSFKARVSARALKESMDKLEELQREQQRMFDESDRQAVEQAERDAELEGERQKEQERANAHQQLLDDINADELERRERERAAYQVLSSRAALPDLTPVDPQPPSGSQHRPPSGFLPPGNSLPESRPISPQPNIQPNMPPTANAAPPLLLQPRTSTQPPAPQVQLPEGIVFPQSDTGADPAPNASQILLPSDGAPIPSATMTKSIVEAPPVAAPTEQLSETSPANGQADAGKREDRGPILLAPSLTGSLNPPAGPIDLTVPSDGTDTNFPAPRGRPAISSNVPGTEPSFFERLLRIPPNEPASLRKPNFNSHNR